MASHGGYELERRRGSVTLLCYHAVFTTKYRRKVITKRVMETIMDALRESCLSNGWTVREVNGEDDHVHMLLGLSPRCGLADAVRILKSNSSMAVRSQRFPEVQRKLWGGAFWSPSYFAVTRGGAPLEMSRRYIENQDSPHE
jgi:putative transposase